MRGVIHGGPGRAAAAAHGLVCRVDVDVADLGEVDHQAVVAHAEATCVVAAAAHGDQHFLIPTEVHGGDDVGRIDAFDDQCRASVDHAVVHLAGVVVASVGWRDDRAAHPGPES